ncbi:MAG: SDR family NAD(P)-dependent oxidoreductase [Desulfosarcinaceae bacterium]
MATSKHIVITGTSRGLGRAIVPLLVDRGHAISGCGRSRSAVQTLSQLYGAPHLFASVDVGDDQQVAHWARTVLEANGPPDLLLNNAGVINRGAPFWEIDAETFDAAPWRRRGGALLHQQVRGRRAFPGPGG